VRARGAVWVVVGASGGAGALAARQARGAPDVPDARGETNVWQWQRAGRWVAESRARTRVADNHPGKAERAASHSHGRRSRRRWSTGGPPHGPTLLSAAIVPLSAWPGSALSVVWPGSASQIATASVGK